MACPNEFIFYQRLALSTSQDSVRLQVAFKCLLLLFVHSTFTYSGDRRELVININRRYSELKWLVEHE